MNGKRGNGEGSVYFEKDRGKWCVAIPLPNGRVKRLRFEKQSAANKALREKLHARDQGRLAMGPRQTIGQFLLVWLEETARPRIRESTYRRYEHAIQRTISPALGKVPLTGLTPLHVQTFQNSLLAAGSAPRSIIKARLVLSSALDHAERWGYLPRNPVRLVDAPRVSEVEREPITLDHAYTLLAAVRGHRLEALYTVALALGLRRSEALGLKWSDVDIDMGALRVRRGLQRLKGGGLQFLELKTKKSRREIAMPRAVANALRAHKERQVFERRAAAELWHETGLVFTSTIGTPLEPRNVNRHFTSVIRRAGLPHMRFHDLRHACATLLLAQGEELKVVQEVLGHSSISTTGDIYAHVLHSLKRGAADKMDALLGAATGA